MICILLMATAGLQVEAQDKDKGNAPSDWIDPATGHRVIRLSPDGGGSSLYFHQNAYTPEGDKLVFNSGKSIVAVDITKLDAGPPKAEVIVAGGAISTAWRTRDVYHKKGGALYATNLDTKVSREVAKTNLTVVNADETLIVGTVNDPEAKVKEEARAKAEGKPLFDDTLAPRGPGSVGGKLGAGGKSMAFAVYDIKTGQTKKIHYSTEWLNHTQFSPTDPMQILFCHEGNWHQVDRVWTIRADGTGSRLLHKRTMVYEIAGHEFFGFDGKHVWYDLQTPRSKEFWLAGINLETGARIRYPIERGNWSVHYNVSRDGKLFAGDGGGPGSVANQTPMPGNKKLDTPGNGQWIHLFTPIPSSNNAMKVGDDIVKIGAFQVERLVDLTKHNYATEPNLTFTPDGKWIVFRANMHGPTHVYAVEVKKSEVKK
jgi:oligogalacturonide lyase